jgi:hypothetical protein
VKDGMANIAGTKSGVYMSMIGVNDAHNANVFPFFANTVEHEFTHQLKGDTQRANVGPFSYVFNEFDVNFRDQMMGWGIEQSALVSGARKKPFTVPQNQQNIKPMTKQ